MDQEQWTAVGRYISDALVPADPVLEAALKASTDAGLPAINVSPPQGKLLHLLARIHGAKTILEIGQLGGSSSLWLPRGTVIMVDNVVRKGAVADAANTDPSIQGVRRLNAMLAKETRVSATTIQTVGSKGYDGFTLAVVN